MRKIIFIASVFAVFLLQSCSKSVVKGDFTVEMGKLKIGCEVGYPPFEYYADDGKTLLGFDIVLGAEIAKKLNLKAEVIDTAWDGIFAGLDTNRYDVIISSVTILPERAENYDFSIPYIGNGQSIILRKDSNLKISEPKDLHGKKVGYQSQCSSDFYINKRAMKENFSFVAGAYDKVLNAYDDLRLGRIDAVVSDYLVAVSYLSSPGSEFKQVWLGPPDEVFGVCVKKGNSVLVEKINSAIEEMKSDGTMKSLYEKIFNMDLSDSIK